MLTQNEKEALKSIWLEISRVMEIWEFKPNNSQLAVAMSAAFLLVTKSKKRQLWTYPPGLGKSRIEVATIFAVFKKAIQGKRSL